VSKFDSWQGQNCSLLHRVQTGSWIHPASYSVDIGDYFTVVKLSGREADNSLIYSVEVNNSGAILPLPHTSHDIVFNYLSTVAAFLSSSVATIRGHRIKYQRFSVIKSDFSRSVVFLHYSMKLRPFFSLFPNVGYYDLLSVYPLQTTI
jgi:hypothetical protein